MERAFDHFLRQLNGALKTDRTLCSYHSGFEISKYGIVPRKIDHIRSVLDTARELSEEERRDLVSEQIESCFTSSFLDMLWDRYWDKSEADALELRKRRESFSRLKTMFPDPETPAGQIADAYDSLGIILTRSNVPLEDVVESAAQSHWDQFFCVASAVLFRLAGTWDARERVAEAIGVPVSCRRRKLPLFAIVALSAHDRLLDAAHIAKAAYQCARKEGKRKGKKKFAAMKIQNFRSYLSRWRARAAELKQPIPADACDAYL